MVRLRIHAIRGALKLESEDEKLLQEFLCATPSCQGRRYTSLDAAQIIHPETGQFHCEHCGSVLALDVGGGEAGDDAERLRRRAESRELLCRFDVEIRPIEEALSRAKASGVDPPEYGSLSDWVATRAAVARDEAKRAKPGFTGRGGALRRDGTFDFLEDTQFELQLEGAPGDGAAAPSGPHSGEGAASAPGSRKRKVVPPWLVRQGMAARAAEQEQAQPQRTADDEYAAEYVRQYSAYLQAMAAAGGAAAAPAGVPEQTPAALPMLPPPSVPMATGESEDEEDWEDV